jgi:hypothetical protein
LKLHCSGPPKINGTKAKGIITTRQVSEGFTKTLLRQRSTAGLRLFIEPKHYGQKCLPLQRGTDGALARISRLSLAAGRCCKAPKLNPSLKSRVVISHRRKNKMLFRDGSLTLETTSSERAVKPNRGRPARDADDLTAFNWYRSGFMCAI